MRFITKKENIAYALRCAVIDAQDRRDRFVETNPRSAYERKLIREWCDERGYRLKGDVIDLTRDRGFLKRMLDAAVSDERYEDAQQIHEEMESQRG